jgi:hypothetical protein
VIGNGNLSRVQDILYHQDKLTITCARSESHSVLFVFRLEKMQLQKIGQFPSLADIAIDEGKTYRTVLTREDSSEFHKAIGLAAHGVGIGSFVYLRRIFERLVISRFEEFETVEGWADDDFPKAHGGARGVSPRTSSTLSRRELPHILNSQLGLALA